MYYKEKKQEIFLKNGKFEQKRDGRRIGTRWKGLGEEEQRPYHQQFAGLKEQKEVNEKWWEERIAKWREERLDRVREGLRAEKGGVVVELDPVKRQNAGLEPICDCSKCGPTSELLPI